MTFYKLAFTNQYENKKVFILKQGLPINLMLPNFKMRLEKLSLLACHLHLKKKETSGKIFMLANFLVAKLFLIQYKFL